MEKFGNDNIARNIAKKRTSAACERRLTDYEIQRQEQIRQNKEEMVKLKLTNICKSLTSLVDSENGKKRKQKVKKDDPNYIPTNEENDSFEIVEGANHSKKQKCIAPLALHRVLRNKKPQGMPRNTSQEQIDPMKKVTSHDAAATVNKDNPSTSFQKKSGHNNKVKSLAGDAGSRMADFLSKIREGTNEESLQVMPSRSEAQDYTLRNKKPQGMSRNTSQEQNNLMKKVTSHDTAAAMNKDEPGTSFQKHSGHNNNVKSLSGDSSIYLADFLRKVREGTNEESLHVMPSRLEAGVEFQTNNHHVEYEVQGHSNMDAWTAEEIFGSAVFDRTGDGDKDSEDDDDAMTYDHVEDGENGDDLNEEVELENDLTIDEGQQGSNSMEKKKKTRGPTMMHAVHTREQRECIILNRFGQPIGPDDKTLNEFSSFLGTIAHNYEFAPLVISTWCRMPSKERMWQYVLKRCAINKGNRSLRKDNHTTGRVSYARIRAKLLHAKEPRDVNIKLLMKRPLQKFVWLFFLFFKKSAVSQKTQFRGYGCMRLRCGIMRHKI